ncbi:MAG: hypothetical protein JRE64_02920 [Deltaproteobacteria bacterium]|nr:hypothetical protein [Deltaproteobacteria bacterium]
MARRKPKFEYAIICDDIRQEISNKLSFIGIYGKDIFVSKISFTFPKLCFAILYKDIKAEDSFSIELITPSGRQLGKTINGRVPKDIKGNIYFNMFAIFSPLTIRQEGSHKLVITFNNDAKMKREVEFVIKKPDKNS